LLLKGRCGIMLNKKGILAMNKDLFVFGSNGKTLDVWLELNDVKKNDVVEGVIKKYFKEYLSLKRKKKSYVEALSFFFLNVFIVMREIEKDVRYKFILVENDYSNNKISKLGFKFRFSFHEGSIYHKNDMGDDVKKRDYLYGKNKVKKDFLISVVKEMEKIDLCKHSEKGNCFESHFQLGFEFINWKKVYDEIYKEDREVILKSIFDKKKKEKGMVDVRIKGEDGGYSVEIDKEKLKSLSRRDEIRKSKEYIEKMRNMYSCMNVELASFEEGNDTQREEILKLWNKKYRNVDFNIDVFNNDVDVLNRYLCSDFKPYRVFHFDEGKLLYGRIYGGILDSKVDNIYKPLLKIDGEYCVSVDIKSCLSQLFVLTECSDVDNNVDFYSYDGLDYFLYRDDIKFLIQCLTYCDSMDKAFKAYRGNSLKNKEYSYIECKKLFNDVVETILNERCYMKDLFFSKKYETLIGVESKFMMKVSEMLMEKEIKHIYLFDAFYIPYSTLKDVLDVFSKISLSLFGRRIKLDYDVELYNSLV